MPTRSLMWPMGPSHSEESGRRGLSSRHFLKLIEDGGEIGFWSSDMAGDHIRASVGLYRILGLDPSVEVTFSLMREMVHPGDRAAQADLLTLLRAGHAVKREFRIIRPDRTQRWISSRAEVLLGADDRPSRAIGVVQDVTERHEARRSVEQEQDRCRALIEATAAVVWYASPDGAVLEMPQWLELTGQSQEEVQRTGWLGAVHPEDRPRTEAAWRTAVSHASPYNTDYRILCADGIYRWFNSRGVPILNRDGSVREWTGVCLAIPGRRRFEDVPPDSSPSPVPPASLDLTPAQIRGARGIVGWSCAELAARASLSVSTVRRLEEEVVTVRPRRDSVAALRRALEEAGAEFTWEPTGLPGVRPTAR